MARSLPIVDDAFPPTRGSTPGAGRPSLSIETDVALGQGGAIARGLEAIGARFESRDGQREMGRAVADAIERESVLLCEAGTGTGKTLAYLVPAILSGKRVVISTATKALQEQIFTKDLPTLDRHLGVPIRAALMKGLSNYVCLRRLHEARTAPNAGLRTDAMLARIEAWVQETSTGDRAELTKLRDDDPSWHDVQSGSDTRIGAGCDFYDRCFVTRMRDAAQRARLVVVNHHLYLADLALRSGGAKQGVIPEHDVVVFDEAHQLPDIATEFFGVRASGGRIESIVRDARRTLTASGRLQRATSRGTAGPMLESISEHGKRFFAELARAGGSSAEGRAHLPADAWDDAVQDHYHRLDAALEAVVAFAKLREGDESREDVVAIGRRVSGLRDDLARIAAPGRDVVAWIDVRARSCVIGISPIDLAPVFRRELFVTGDRSRPQTIVLTSATLATAGARPFEHAKRRLGLVAPPPAHDPDDPRNDLRNHLRDDPEDERSPSADEAGPRAIELVVSSPFDFPRRAGVYVPLDLPEPTAAEFLARAGVRVLELVRASGGGAFVLCASTRNMRAFHAMLREADLGLPLLCQGESPKLDLLARFRAAGDAVLVATMGFWEGVDVPGRSLRLVVIDKLPFAVPSDPIVAARHRAVEETGRSSFAELSVPEAAISLKQGFGRLIRTRDDAGVVAILDKRLRTKGYGRVLRASLPPAAPLHELADVRGFFEVVVGVERGRAPADLEVDPNGS